MAKYQTHYKDNNCIVNIEALTNINFNFLETLVLCNNESQFCRL